MNRCYNCSNFSSNNGSVMGTCRKKPHEETTNTVIVSLVSPIGTCQDYEPRVVKQSLTTESVKE